MNPTRTRRCFPAAFKAQVALAALTGRQSLAELAARYQVSAAQVCRWKQHLLEQAAQVFAEPAPSDVEPLYAAIGRLQLEIQLLKSTLPPSP